MMRVLLDDLAPHAILRLAGAQRGTYIHIDSRSKPVEEIPAYRDRPEFAQRDWFGFGMNHGVKNGGAYRELERDCWYIAVYSVEDLHSVLKRTGASVKSVPSTENLLELVTE